MSWPQTSLSKAYWFQEGPGVRKWQFKTEGIKLLNVGNIEKDGRLNLAKTDRCIAESEANTKYKHFLVDEGDLVIASSGISIDNDGLLRTRGSFVAEADLPLCLNTSTIRFKAIEGVSDLNFLRHWLQSKEFRIQITRFVTGSAQLNFGPSHLKATRIALPPLEEQRRIAGILDGVEDLRAKRRAAIALLDQLPQAIFLKMFGDPAINSMGWSVHPIKDVVAGKAGVKAGPFGSAIKKEDYVSSGYRVYGQEQVIAGRFDIGDYFIDDRKYRKLASCAVSPGDLLMSLVGSFGRVLVVPDRVTPGVINPRLLKITPDTKLITSIFLANQIQFTSIQHKLSTHAHGGTMGVLNAGILKELVVITPPIDLQIQFAARLESIYRAKSAHQSALTELDAAFASLQAKAFCSPDLQIHENPC